MQTSPRYTNTFWWLVEILEGVPVPALSTLVGTAEPATRRESSAAIRWAGSCLLLALWRPLVGRTLTYTLSTAQWAVQTLLPKLQVVWPD